MKLYTAKLSPFAARCRMQIYAKNLDVQLLEYPHQVSKQELLDMHPLGKIPILSVYDRILVESQSICEYLEDHFPDNPLRPADALDRATMRSLCRMADLYVFEELSTLFPHLSRKRRDSEVVERGLANIARGLGAVEHFMADSSFAIGDHLSLADCCLAPVVLFVHTYLPYFDQTQPLSGFPKLDRYWTNIQENEFAARVIQEITEGMAEKSGKKS